MSSRSLQFFRKTFCHFSKNGRIFIPTVHRQRTYGHCVAPYLYSDRQQHTSQNTNIGVKPLIAAGLIFASCDAETKDKVESTENRSQTENTQEVETKKEPDDSEVKSWIAEAIYQLGKGQYDGANEAGHEALKVIQKYQKEELWPAQKILRATIYAYDIMGKACFHGGKLDEAHALFKECIKGLIQDGGSMDDGAVVELSLKLAMIYAMQGKIEEAEIGYNFCVDQLTRKIEEQGDDMSEAIKQNTQALLGMCLHSFGKFLLETKRYIDAEAKIEKSLNLGILVFGKDHSQVAVLHSDLANTLVVQGKYEKALVFVKQAQEMADPESMNMGFFLCNQGPIAAQLKDFDLAHESCEKALNLANLIDSPELAKGARECRKRVKNIQKELKKNVK